MANPALLVVENPRHRAKRKTTHRRRRRSAVKIEAARNPRRKRRVHHRAHRMFRVRARRNPRMFPRTGVMSQLQPALIGSIGALANDIAVGYLAPHLPSMFQSQNMRILVKAGFALGLGVVAEKVIARSTAREATVGALTVALHEGLRSVMSSAAPSIPLGEYLQPPMMLPQPMPARLGEYLGELVGPSTSAYLDTQGELYGSHTTGG